MILRIENSARDYDWGSKTLMSDYLGLPATGRPMAEVWFGTHHGSPALVASSSQSATSTPAPESLATLESAIGHRLSFLLKILAAETPLSIQAHPTTSQAQAGFARENAAGISLSAHSRNYKDDRSKPELIVALSDFRALCGFKTKTEIEALLADFEAISTLSDHFIATAKHWRVLLSGTNGIRDLLVDLLARRENFGGFCSELAGLAEFEAQFELAAELNLLYPGDPGVMIAMLMNHFWLEPGEALYLPAGNIHAYLSGLGVEVMAASDNVLRGGLTSKHIDPDELIDVIDFDAEPVQVLRAKNLNAGLAAYQTDATDFALYRAEVSASTLLAELELPAEAIVLCTEGEVAVSESLGNREVLRRGQAVYLDNSAQSITLAGSGTVFLATGPIS